MARECDDHVVITEPALDGRDVAIAFELRGKWPKMSRFL